VVVEKSKKILITGAGGMLGSALLKTLDNHFKVLGCTRRECDITDKNKVESVINSFLPDIVIHCAAYTNVEKAEDEQEKAFFVNREGTRNIFKVLEDKDCLIVYISTDYVFDGKKNSPYLEQDLPSPINVYGKSKLEGEKIVKNFKKHLIIRTSWLFGPCGENFITKIIRKAEQDKVIKVVDDQKGSPTYTFDLSYAIKDIIDISLKRRIEYGIYHITNSGICSWFEFARYIKELTKIEVEILPVTSKESTTKAERPLNSVLSNDKFFNLVGYKLRNWKEAVKEYIQNYLNN
jgi:dTDP-4-dehydrorhamnose reductase